MAKNKKHHFVPRFYLKLFSEDGMRIRLFNIPRELRVDCASLRDQCYRKWLYGKEDSIESDLGGIEGTVAEIIGDIVNHSRLPEAVSEERGYLLFFVLIQRARTAYAASVLNEGVDQIAKHILARGVDGAPYSQEDLDRVTIGHKEIAKVSIARTASNYPLLFDLSWKLIINECDEDFVTSDNPVVLYNQLFEYRKDAPNIGLACKGLQIFFPLSPRYSLLIFDPGVYTVGRRGDSTLILDQYRDLEQINKLQFIAAQENIYFLRQSFNVDRAFSSAKGYRRDKKTNLRVFSGPPKRDRMSEYVAYSEEGVQTNLKLSFLRVTRNAKKWRRKFQKQRPQPAVIVRNQKLCDIHDLFLSMVDAGEYEPHQFFDFLNTHSADSLLDSGGS